jgi:hypothetical protein
LTGGRRTPSSRPSRPRSLVDIEPFEAAAEKCGAEYREILLTAGKPVACRRFAERAANGDAATKGVDDVLQERGGTVLVERIHDQLAAYLPQRPGCVVVPTDGCGPRDTYEAVLAHLRAG